MVREQVLAADAQVRGWLQEELARKESLIASCRWIVTRAGQLYRVGAEVLRKTGSDR